MASMDLGTINQDLNRRFAAPLPEFYTRRVIFWYDEDREFEDKIDDIELTDAKIVKLTGSNTFAVKQLLAHDDTASNYLVYRPFGIDKPDDDWLINIELYSEEFRADLGSIWMDEMGLSTSPILRKQVRQYKRFFAAKDRRAKVSALSKNIATAPQFHLAVMAAICGIKDTQPNSIIRAVVKGGLDIETNAVYQSLVNYDAQNPFWVMVAQATGYKDGDEVSLGKLAIHMLLTAATRTLRQEYLMGLDGFISIPHQSYCYDFISEWLRGEDASQLYRVARYVEEEARLPQRFAKLSVSDLADTECFPCINEIILTQLMTEISNQIIQTDAITAVVNKRRTMAWYDEVSCYYDGIMQMVNMQTFFHDHSTGFHTVEPQKIWKEYTEDYYRMDTYYRQFHMCYNRCLKVSNMQLDDLFKQVVDKVEGLYSVWFLGGLAGNWTNAACDELALQGCIDNVPMQESFYSNKVKTADSKVYVIISDALRYEVAAGITQLLRQETQSKVELTSQMGIYPTITPYGMAALLPHRKLTVQERPNGSLAVLADDMSTEMPNRDKVLKTANANSVALQYKNIIGMKRADRQALVKGMDVVYIYHDKIDEASHTSDASVFPACEDATQEIMNLVRIIVNEFGGTRIFITADHGFLYTYSPLSEDSKVGKDSWNGKDVEYGRRYAILREGATPDFLTPVKFIGQAAGYEAYAPRENIRIKMNGGGLNFVHGGISLQEMVVPVIDYHFLRTATKSYQRNKSNIDTKPVEISLLSANRKISNMIFSLNFYQKDAVGANRTPATYLLYFTDASGTAVSDTVKLIADRTSSNAQDRSFRCTFNLKSRGFDNKDSYYLIIADETGLQMPVREEFQIDIAFAVDEFNFF